MYQGLCDLETILVERLGSFIVEFGFPKPSVFGRGLRKLYEVTENVKANTLEFYFSSISSFRRFRCQISAASFP